MISDPMEFALTAKRWTEEYLEKLFKIYEGEAESIDSKLVRIVEAAKDYTLRGGKRLRAMLILAGYWSRDPGLDPEPVKYLMASIEFLQSYLLIHDDIMDRDEVRRGGPTVHVMFNRYCVNERLLGDCIHYGISQAILVGDYLNALVFTVLADLPFSHDIIVKLVKRYCEGLRAVSYGQYLDLYLAYNSISKVKEEDVLKVHELKTASYTVELPLHLGAIAANISDQRLYNVFTRFAKYAGIAFQLRDDILGLYGDPKVTGKPVGSDVREKKKTLLVIKAYEWGGSEDKRILEEIYDKKSSDEITDHDVYVVQDIVKRTGSLDYNEKLINNYYNEALKILRESSTVCDWCKNVLEWLLKKLVYRVK